MQGVSRTDTLLTKTLLTIKYYIALRKRTSSKKSVETISFQRIYIFLRLSWILLFGIVELPVHLSSHVSGALTQNACRNQSLNVCAVVQKC